MYSEKNKQEKVKPNEHFKAEGSDRQQTKNIH